MRLPGTLAAFALYSYGYHDIAIYMYVVVAVLDATDGIFARGAGLVSERGKSLDPLIDKMTYFIPLIYFASLGHISPWLVGIFILIDTL